MSGWNPKIFSLKFDKLSSFASSFCVWNLTKDPRSWLMYWNQIRIILIDHFTSLNLCIAERCGAHVSRVAPRFIFRLLTREAFVTLDLRTISMLFSKAWYKSVLIKMWEAINSVSSEGWRVFHKAVGLGAPSSLRNGFDELRSHFSWNKPSGIYAFSVYAVSNRGDSLASIHRRWTNKRISNLPYTTLV